MIIDLGKSDYNETLKLQRNMADLRNRGQIADTVIFVEHPDVYTEGRHTEKADSIEKGQQVSIYMKNGYLRASSSVKSHAHGISDRDAVKESILGVTRIDGIIDIEFGQVEINIIPSGSEIPELKRKFESIVEEEFFK